MSEWIAITGGCGYVGSHIAAAIKQTTDYKTLLIDSRANLLPHTFQYADTVVSDDYVSDHSFTAINAVRPVAIVHCAASSLVGPSLTNPDRYYENNVVKLIKLLNFMNTNDHKRIVFSSSSSVYGNGDGISPFIEYTDLRPVSVYGRSKLIGEILLQDYCQAYNINSVSFRYFNAVGALDNGTIGQEPNATHLIARLLESVLNNTEFELYGDDWPTHDKTCVRDYVHVSDIADAHIKGIEWLKANAGANVYNIGSGTGHSVKEVIAAVERVTGHTVTQSVTSRRLGDPAWLIANTARIKSDLGWVATKNLDQVVADAYRWYNSTSFKNMQR